MSTLFTNFLQNINQIAPLEHDFTEVLASIALKPKLLYFYGKLPQNVSKGAQQIRPKTVAIVGSRHNTKYGEEVAYKLAYELAKHQVIVISGLAFGIDSIAHQGCLDAGGTTIAVLGTRIDRIYPRSHESIARRIIEQNGAIISEYAPGNLKNAPLAPAEAGFDGRKWVSFAAEDSSLHLEKPFNRRQIEQKASFLYRNRLISGLSDIVVVVEAAERSGSLNTATHALNQGKDVFAVPGNINNPYSQGCNKLIKQGAIPYTEPKDILELLFPEDYLKKHKKMRQANLIGDTDIETKILQALSDGLRSGEDITNSTHLPPEVFNEAVTLLEIKSRVRSLGANNWTLV